MDILPTPSLAQALPFDGSTPPSADATGDDPFLALLASLLQPQHPPLTAPLPSPDEGTSDVAAAPVPAAPPTAMPARIVQAPVHAPVLPEPTRAQLDTPAIAEPATPDLLRSASPSTAGPRAGIAKPERKEAAAEPEPHGRPRARPAAAGVANPASDPRPAQDAPSEPPVPARAAVAEASPPDRDTSDPAPPRLPDAPPPASPAQVRAAAVADPPLAAQPPVAGHPVILPSPDHRGRVVSARLVVAQDDGGSSVRIDLEPADLGRVEVALRVDDAGLASATFTVDRPETLQLLQRDARTVGELLGSAGFTVQRGALGFTLRDSPGGQHGSERGGRAASARDGPAVPARQLARRDGLLDLRV